MRKYLITAMALVSLANNASALDGRVRVNFVLSATKNCVENAAKGSISPEKVQSYCECFANKTADNLTLEETVDAEIHGVGVKDISDHMRSVAKSAMIFCAKQLD